MNIKKIIITLTSTIGFLLIGITPAFAHVIVTPNQVGIAKTQIFTMTVPNEKTSSTVGIKLLVPDGLENVVPNVKPGWTIDVKKNGDTITEIDWTGGTIPPEQRDEFLFEAQAPTKATTVKWKAYQMYQDGSTVAWVNNPTGNPEDDNAPPPYSQTKVVNDLTGSNTASMNQSSNNTNEMMAFGSKRATLPLWFSIIAIALSAVAISISLRKKK